jgi:hypothetical protein
MQAVGPGSRPLVGVLAPRRDTRQARIAAVRAVELLAVLALTVATVATRLAIRTRYLFNWDSVQFALGVQRFDIVAHRPHPPGYLGYVMLGRLLTSVSGGNAEAGLVLLSALAEAAAVLLAFAAARHLWGRFAGWCAALLLFTSPLFWFYGGTALSYALEPALSIGVLWAAYAACRGSRPALVIGALVVGTAGAIRPTDEAFLAVPLAWAAWRAWRSGGWRPLLTPMLVLAAASLAWLVPLIAMSGGPGRYLTASRELSAKASSTSALWKTGLYGLQLNGSAVLAGLALAVGLFAPLGLAFMLVRRLPGRAAALGHLAVIDRDYAVVAGALLMPALGVYLLVHIGQLGYILLLLPALLLPSGRILESLARTVFPASRAWTATIASLAACVLVNLATFALPADGLRAQLVQHDDYTTSVISTVRTFDPATTALVASAEANGSYRMAQFYLPDYPLVALGRDRHKHAGEMFSTTGSAPEYDLARFDRAGRLVLPAGVRQVVVLDRDAANLVGDRRLLDPLVFGDNWHAWTASIDGTASPAIAGSWVYLDAADCPCQGAGTTRPQPVPHQPL